jgi:hypothetical protein
LGIKYPLQPGSFLCPEVPHVRQYCEYNSVNRNASNSDTERYDPPQEDSHTDFPAMRRFGVPLISDCPLRNSTNNSVRLSQSHLQASAIQSARSCDARK